MFRSLTPALVVALSSGALAQDAPPATPSPKPPREATLSDAASVRPVPPTGVSALLENPRKMVISWKPIPLEKIVGYDVYRKVGAAAYVKLDRVKGSVFVDKNVPDGDVHYAVVSVDRFDLASRMSKSVSKATAQGAAADSAAQKANGSKVP